METGRIGLAQEEVEVRSDVVQTNLQQLGFVAKENVVDSFRTVQE